MELDHTALTPKQEGLHIWEGPLLVLLQPFSESNGTKVTWLFLDHVSDMVSTPFLGLTLDST